MALEEEINDEKQFTLRSNLGLLGTLFGSMIGLAILWATINPMDRLFALIRGKSYETYRIDNRDNHIKYHTNEAWEYDLDKNNVLDKQEYRKFIEEQYDNNPRNK